MASLIFILLAVPATTSPSPDYPNWTSFVLTVLPYLTIFGLVWKAIDKVFEYLGRKTREQMIDVAKSYITPLMDEIRRELGDMREERKKDNEKLREEFKATRAPNRTRRTP